MQNIAYHYVAKTFEKNCTVLIFPSAILNTLRSMWTQRIVGIFARWGSSNASFKILGILKNKGREFQSVLNLGTVLGGILFYSVEHSSFTLGNSHRVVVNIISWFSALPSTRVGVGHGHALSIVRPRVKMLLKTFPRLLFTHIPL